MDDMKKGYSADELIQAAEECGRLFALFANGFMKGVAEQRAALQKAEKSGCGVDAENKGCSDCCNCWCDQCESLDTCLLHREGITEQTNGVPFPCCGCKKGERFAPIEKKAPCEHKAG